MAPWMLICSTAVLLCVANLAVSVKDEKHFAKTTVEIRDITDTSAVMEWIVPKKGEHNHVFKVSCNKDTLKSLEFPATKNAKHVTLKDLRPNTNYSCSLLAADDETTDNKWTHIMDPIHFRTLKGTVSTEEEEENDDFVSKYKKMAARNLPLLLGCILVPIFLVALCIGGCIICSKVKEYRRDKEENKRIEQLSSNRSRPLPAIPGETQKLAHQMRTKYQLLPEQSQPTSSTSTSREQKNKDTTPQEFNQALVDVLLSLEQTQLPAEYAPASCSIPLLDSEYTMTPCASCDSKISLASQTSLAAVSASVLPSVTSVDIPQWSKFAVANIKAPRTPAHITLDDILPPIPPPSEDDIIV